MTEPGLYFGTFDAKQGKPRYLVRLGTPGAVLGEGEDASGRIGGTLVPSPREVYAVRFPFVPTDQATMFTTDGTTVTQAQWLLSVPGAKPGKELDACGWIYEVRE